MAFFKSFQESLSSVSVSSILDSVSSTVSNTVDGVKTAVSDVTYTVSDQLTEQVSTIINKKQGEEEDKGKRDEGETSSKKDVDSRTGAAERINSKRHAYADEEEERREREKQEEERRNEEEQWEWCYAPSKGWYRKRRDPNQKDTSTGGQETREKKTEAGGQLSSSNTNVTTARTDNDEGGQEDTNSRTNAETAHGQETRTEQCPNNDAQGHAPEGHAQEGHVLGEHTPEEAVQEKHAPEGHTPEKHTPEKHVQEGHVQEGHAPNRDDYNEGKSAERRHSTTAKPNQNTEGGASGGGPAENSDVERQLLQERDNQEGGGSRSGSPSVLKDLHDEDEDTRSPSLIEVTDISEDKRDPERSFKKERFRRCTLL